LDVGDDLIVSASCFFVWRTVFLRRHLGDKASRKMRRPGRLIFSALLFFPYFSPFPSIFLVIWHRLALPRLRRRLKGKKGVNRHASPYRLKNYVGDHE
jgi:hypothetical protein